MRSRTALPSMSRGSVTFRSPPTVIVTAIEAQDPSADAVPPPARERDGADAGQDEQAWLGYDVELEVVDHGGAKSVPGLEARPARHLRGQAISGGHRVRVQRPRQAGEPTPLVGVREDEGPRAHDQLAPL